MYKMRQIAVRHAGLYERFYRLFIGLLRHLDPILNFIGYTRLEKPVATFESGIKGFLFDCRMCGHCILSDTGMSCPTNCPKNLRNGPCGGVRSDGKCEVKPEMTCVWLEAWKGSQKMSHGDQINKVQRPLDFRRFGSSSWLFVIRNKDYNTDKIVPTPDKIN